MTRAPTSVRAAVAVPSPAVATAAAVARGRGRPIGSPRPTASLRRKCALVVDRDPNVVRSLADCLLPELEVHVATTPVLAACLLEELPQIDLAFVELELPGHAGEELLQALGHWPDAIRILTAQRSGIPHADLPSNRYLVHLVLSKPLVLPIVWALKRATLGLHSS